MSKLQKMIKAAAGGCRRPYWAMRSADDVGIPFALICAVLEKESSGGKNIFGHDPTIFIGAGRVTEKKYLAYKAERDRIPGRRRMQGVGPMQLTWYTFQDRADELGGCWKPRYNIQVGAEFLRELWDKHDGDVVKIGEEYNGRLSYGQDLWITYSEWRSRLS